MKIEESKKKPEENILKRFESDIIKWFIAGVVTVIGTMVVFYFNTNATLASHTNSIIKIENRLAPVEESINELKSVPEINQEQYKSIEKLIQEMSDRQKRVEERQDKMYDIVIEMAGKRK